MMTAQRKIHMPSHPSRHPSPLTALPHRASLTSIHKPHTSPITQKFPHGRALRPPAPLHAADLSQVPRGRGAPAQRRRGVFGPGPATRGEAKHTPGPNQPLPPGGTVHPLGKKGLSAGPCRRFFCRSSLF